MLKFIICGEELILHENKAVFWPEKRILILTDLHLGKIVHFRKSGIGLPPNAENENFQILNDLICEFSPLRILILGDLFHSDYNNEWEKFCEFVKVFPDIQVELVLGNHDILGQEKYLEAGLTLTKLLNEGPFLFTHHPLDEILGNAYNICGHIHPAYCIKGRAKQTLKLPCFYFGKQQAILPAFGIFTGTVCITPVKTDRVFVIAGSEIIKIE